MHQNLLERRFVERSPHVMKKGFTFTALIIVMTLVALIAIAMVAAISLLLVQSANATNVMTSTTEGEVLGAEEPLSTTITTDNNSYDLLGSLFLIGEDENTSFNPINETFSEISFVNNVTIMPPNAMLVRL